MNFPAKLGVVVFSTNALHVACRLEKERNQLQLECEDLFSNLDSIERSKVIRAK